MRSKHTLDCEGWGLHRHYTSHFGTSLAAAFHSLYGPPALFVLEVLLNLAPVTMSYNMSINAVTLSCKLRHATMQHTCI